MKFSNIIEYHFNSDNVTGYLSDFSNYNPKTDHIKLHEETITKNEISSVVDVNNFEPIGARILPLALADVNNGTGSLDTSGYSGTFSASAL